MDTHLFVKRHALIRRTFDELEEKWMLENTVVVAKAAALKKEGKDQEAAELLYRFTESCTEEALKTIASLKKMFSFSLICRH